MFRRGLKDYIKDELTRSGAALETLRELIKELININNKWYERSIEKKHDYYYRRSRFVLGTINWFRPRNNKYHDRTILIEINTVKRVLFKGRKQREQGKSKKVLTCYGCRKPGHIQRNYRLGVVPRPQVNIIRRVPI